MKNFLHNIGLNTFYAVGGQAPEITLFERGDLRSFPMDDILSEQLQGLPAVVYGKNHPLDDEFHFSLSDENDVWDILELTKNFFPTLSDFSFSSLCDFYGVKDDLPSARLANIFVRILEHVARLDLKSLSLIQRILEPTSHPLKALFKRTIKVLKESPDLIFQYPPIKWPCTNQNVIGESLGPIDSDSVERINPDVIKGVFDKTSVLETEIDHYEKRGEQMELARHITEAFNSGQFLMAEAGTGTGKSLAYLVPAVYWTSQNLAYGESVVISTHTKNLQDQLFYKDIPLLSKILSIPFRAVLLKGRSNYLCMKKWKEILADPDSHLKPDEREAIVPIYFWASRTTTGDISECSGFNAESNRALWHKLASESFYCQAQKCNASEDCFIKKIRAEARKAHVTVINHALLFSDLVSDNAVLGEYHNLVIDEAHHLERVAQNYLGVEFSMWSVKSLLSGLYERDRFETGALIRLRQKLKNSKFSKKEADHYQTIIFDVTQACVELWTLTQAYFQTLSLEAARLKDEKNARENKFRYQSENSLLKNPSPEQKDFFDAIQNLDGVLTMLVESMKDWKSSVFEDADDVRQSLAMRVEELRLLGKTYETLAQADQKNYVYWFELPMRERSSDLRFYGVPLNIGEILRGTLFGKLNTCIFSSATLSVAGHFEYYKSRIGLDAFDDSKVKEYSAGSPFDFNEQCKIFVMSAMPDPSDRQFPAACQKVIHDVVVQLKKGTLSLFTSYGMMHECYGGLKEKFDDVQVTLLMQGKDGTRTHLAERFRSDKTSVLFGTDSFWEGVDVPGEALEVLIITKLPFEVPSDPLVAAKMERIDRMGGRSFLDYSVPEAVIRFRQGFGRLIRSRSDRGIVVILDNRVITKAYGKLFLNSLPVRAEEMRDEKLLIQGMKGFFDSSG